MDPSLIDDPALKTVGSLSLAAVLWRFWRSYKSDRREDSGADKQAGANVAGIDMLEKALARQEADINDLRALLDVESARRRAAETRIAILEAQVIKLGGTL